MNRENFLLQLPELVKNYQPASNVISQIRNVSLLIVIGASGVGKSTVIKKLSLPFVPSDTTRSPRVGEEDGIDYYFLNNYDRVFEDITNGQFVQIAVGPTGDLYATKATSYPNRGIAVLPVVADVIPVFRQLGFKSTVSAFITPPSYNEWVRRMSEHGIDEAQLDGRLAEAYRSFKFAINDTQTHFILNDDLDKAATQVSELVSGKVQEDRELEARKVAQDILNRLA